MTVLTTQYWHHFRNLEVYWLMLLWQNGSGRVIVCPLRGTCLTAACVLHYVTLVCADWLGAWWTGTVKLVVRYTPKLLEEMEQRFDRQRTSRRRQQSQWTCQLHQLFLVTLLLSPSTFMNCFSATLLDKSLLYRVTNFYNNESFDVFIMYYCIVIFEAHVDLVC